jgi:hypothetical protein
MSTELVTSLTEVASAVAIVVGVALVFTVGVALIAFGLLGMLFSARVSS